QFLPRHRLLRRTLIGAAFLVAARGWFLRPELVRELRRPNPQAPMVEDVLELIRLHYADSLGDDDLSFRAVKGILRSLPDPYSTLLASGDLKRYRDLLEGTAGEAGLVLLEGPLGLTVGEVVPRSPAAEKGIRAGDRLLEIEGARTEAWTAPRGEQALRGEPGSTVTLVTRRPGLAEREHFTMRRERVPTLAPATRWFTPSVGYIRLTSVSRGSTQALEAEVTRLVRQGARGVVLDLRNNPGGLLNEATALLDLFLDRGAPIGAVETR